APRGDRPLPPRAQPDVCRRRLGDRRAGAAPRKPGPPALRGGGGRGVPPLRAPARGALSEPSFRGRVRGLSARRAPVDSARQALDAGELTAISNGTALSSGIVSPRSQAAMVSTASTIRGPGRFR